MRRKLSLLLTFLWRPRRSWALRSMSALLLGIAHGICSPRDARARSVWEFYQEDTEKKSWNGREHSASTPMLPICCSIWNNLGCRGNESRVVLQALSPCTYGWRRIVENGRASLE